MRVIAAVLLAALCLDPSPALVLAAQGDCSQPVTNGDGPTASDCLFILGVAVQSQVCLPACVCAPKGSLPTTATDALICLQRAVGQDVPLTCPACGGTTTSTTSSTTSTTSTTMFSGFSGFSGPGGLDAPEGAGGSQETAVAGPAPTTTLLVGPTTTSTLPN